jgi:uncharacterized membrane protein
LKDLVRFLIAFLLIVAGLGHLFWLRIEFQAQVPNWLPLDPDFVVVSSGFVEIILGLILLFWQNQRINIGWIVALFFAIVFIGNLNQYFQEIDAFGLDSDLKRLIRLPFQPLIIYGVLWACNSIVTRKKA